MMKDMTLLSVLFLFSFAASADGEEENNNLRRWIANPEHSIFTDAWVITEGDKLLPFYSYNFRHDEAIWFTSSNSKLDYHSDFIFGLVECDGGKAICLNESFYSGIFVFSKIGDYFDQKCLYLNGTNYETYWKVQRNVNCENNGGGYVYSGRDKSLGWGGKLFLLDESYSGHEEYNSTEEYNTYIQSVEEAIEHL